MNPSKQEVLNWNIKKVCEWLNKLSLNGNYEHLLEKEAVDGSALLKMKLEDWKEIGMKNESDLACIDKHVKLINNDDESIQSYWIPVMKLWNEKNVSKWMKSLNLTKDYDEIIFRLKIQGTDLLSRSNSYQDFVPKMSSDRQKVFLSLINYLGCGKSSKELSWKELQDKYSSVDFFKLCDALGVSPSPFYFSLLKKSWSLQATQAVGHTFKSRLKRYDNGDENFTDYSESEGKFVLAIQEINNIKKT